MWVSPRFFLLLGCFNLIQSDNEEYPDEAAIVHIDVQRIKPRNSRPHQSRRIDRDSIEGAFKVQWSGNGDFQPHHQVPETNLVTEAPPWDSQTLHGEFGSIDTERSSPATILQPPFQFYSSSIHDFANEDTSTVSSDYDESSERDPRIKTLRVYEITKPNASWTPLNSVTTGPSFVISDPSSEAQSFDSLRSVIRKKNITRLNDVNRADDTGSDSGANGLNDRSPDVISRTNVIGVNPGKGNGLRGNRKYHDETSVRRNSWSTTQRYNWRRPVNRVNHFRFSDSSEKVGAVPGVPGRDYPVHHENIPNQLQNVVGRFPCPSDPVKHFYLADRASRCQVFYVCYGGEKGVPMLCPNGTLFNEQIQVCDWWFNVVC